MTGFIAFTIFGIVSGGAYAISASGLVLTYTTSRVFNMAHGALGMFMAFVYWELHYHHHLATWLSVLLVVGVLAPLLGAVVERVMRMRLLADAPVSVSLVVTVGLLVFAIGGAQGIWKPAPRPVQGWFVPHGLHLGGKGGPFITANDMITIGLALAVAVVLYLFLSRTRTGIAMRAVVDNANLLALHGTPPGRLSTLSWAAGSSLAALAGVLLIPTIGLDYFALTLLVVNAYAAAVLGRLRSLPLTFIGAMVLGLLQSYATGYLPSSWPSGVEPAIPALLLFGFLLLLPQTQLRVGQLRGIRSVPVPSGGRAAGFGLVLVVGVWLFSLLLSPSQTSNLSLGIAFGLIMLSVVLLTGYGGFVSLVPLSFAGLGALVVARLATTSPWAIVLGGLVAAAAGFPVALISLRLSGLYFALATLAFGEILDNLVFSGHFAFGSLGSLDVKRMSLFGFGFGSERSYLLLLTVAFVLVGMVVLALRRGTYGRLLIAMRDSPAACGTLGLNLTWTRVGLVMISTGLAGLAGGLYAGLEQNVGATTFQVFESLPLMLMAIVGGGTSVTGALLGGVLYMEVLTLPAHMHAVGQGIVGLIIGVAAISLGRNPNGLASYVFSGGRWVWSLVRHRTPSSPAGGAVATEPLYLPEEVAVGGASRG